MGAAGHDSGGFNRIWVGARLLLVRREPEGSMAAKAAKGQGERPWSRYLGARKSSRQNLSTYSGRMEVTFQKSFLWASGPAALMKEQ